ncbi:hypothetical protein BDV24DRAFT_369 [Aspergillus arachidicola]|uniref:F-box domain-containing protein n=1 Tax=Aspergillus arachidicola TaxID=656916 RepID=A0A5N6YSK3_9EURO|nr:hypothetical protein BDV24DRAFT_369 [Aspergillus arachidicola]
MTELPASPLLDLPTNLRRLIIHKLDYPSRLSLSQTNKYFRSLIPTQHPSTLLLRRRYLCDKETWPGYEKYFACGRCLQLLHYSHFTSGQVRGRRAKLCSEKYLRVCLGCLHCQAHECFMRSRNHNGNQPGPNGPGINVGLRAAQATVPPYWPPSNPVQPPAYPALPSVYPAQPSTYLAHPSMYLAQPSVYPVQPFTYSAVPPVSVLNYYNGHGGSYSPGRPYYIYRWLATLG